MKIQSQTPVLTPRPVTTVVTRATPPEAPADQVTLGQGGDPTPPPPAPSGRSVWNKVGSAALGTALGAVVGGFGAAGVVLYQGAKSVQALTQKIFEQKERCIATKVLETAALLLGTAGATLASFPAGAVYGALNGAEAGARGGVGAVYPSTKEWIHGVRDHLARLDGSQG